MDDLLHVLRIFCNILLYFFLFFPCKLRMVSTSCMIIESCKMTRFPSIKPVIYGQTSHIKTMDKVISSLAIKAQENTMSTLSDTVMLTLFIASTKQMLCLKAEPMHESHLLSSPVQRMFCPTVAE